MGGEGEAELSEVTQLGGAVGRARDDLVRDEVVGGDIVVGEGGGQGEPAPRKVQGGGEGVHVLGGCQAPSEEAPGVGVAGEVVQGDLRQKRGVGGVAREDVVSVGGDGAKMWSMAVARAPWRVVKLVAGGMRRCQEERGPRAPTAEAMGGARGTHAVEVAEEDAQAFT